MSEESVVESATNVAESAFGVQSDGIETVTETPKLDPIEEHARAKGWRPESEFNGNPEDFVSAKEYMRVGEMIDRQKNLERQLKAVAKQNQDMYKKFQDAEIQGYQRAVEELKLSRQEALEVGDAARADQITDQMNSYKETINQEQQKAKQAQVSPDVVDFCERNKDWFRVDQKLTQLAIIRDHELRIKHPEKTDSEIFQIVENEFSPRKRANPPPVATPSRSSESVSKTKFSINDLTRDERDVFNGIKQADPNFTVDQYVKQLKEIGAR